MCESHLSADIDVLAEFMRRFALGGLHMTPQNSEFVAGALDKLASKARTLEADFTREENWRRAADARVEALKTPDHVAKAYREIAIAEGRRAGTVIDLRRFLEREWPKRAPNAGTDVSSNGRASADLSSDGKDSGDAA